MIDKKKGFKAFDGNFRCRGFQYKAGETAKHDGTVRVNYSGLHYFYWPLSVLDCYFPPDAKFAEVEAVGIVEHDTDQSCTAELRIAKELSLKDLIVAQLELTFSFCFKSKSKKVQVTAETEHASAARAAQLAASGTREAGGPRGRASWRPRGTRRSWRPGVRGEAGGLGDAAKLAPGDAAAGGLGGRGEAGGPGYAAAGGPGA